ncbi:MAG: putative mycofactocin radical SAM maturase MftC [Nitrospira sp.]|nr:putative mycofactocin radical SAM maturase MftC [Nitrospira sp.]
MSTPRLYRKGDSFRSLSGSFSTEAVFTRIDTLRADLPYLAVTPEMSVVLDRALADLAVVQADRTESTFFLRPHTIEELARLTDAELPRYLYHRFRYDVFPRTKELDAYPPCVQIEPTSICNFRCVFCFQTDPLLTLRKHGHAGQMSVDMFKRVVDQIEGHVEFVTLASRGEPLMTKGIEEMLAYASGKFLGFKMNTNATFLNEMKAHAILQAELNTLVFSADAADAETYVQLRVNGDFEKVMGNIRRFKEIKERDYPDTRLITRVPGVAFDRERQDHQKIEEFWREYVDQVAFVDYNPWENTYDNQPNGIEEACSELWRRCFVWWDGKMNPCDVDYRSFLCPGTVEEQSVSDIWTGRGYCTLREKHLERQRQSLSPCQGCVSV